MKRMMMMLTVMALALLLAGCGSFWEDQGTASRTSAEARLRQADAARQNAQAAIIDAEARGALAESQARALTTAMDQNSRLTRDVVDLVDNSEFVWMLGGVAVLALGVAGVALWGAARRGAAPAAPAAAAPAALQIATIDTLGGSIKLVQEPAESAEAFQMRLLLAVAAAGEREQRLLEAVGEAMREVGHGE